MAIVSNDLVGQYNPLRSQGPLDESVRVRRTRALEDSQGPTREDQTRAKVASKPVRQAKVAMERLV